MSGGHATFLVKNGRVTQILYSGEKNATFAPDAYCAPIMRTCIANLQQTQPAMTQLAPSAPVQGHSQPAAPP